MGVIRYCDIPEMEDMPEFHYTDQIAAYYLIGMYHKALDLKEELLK